MVPRNAIVEWATKYPWQHGGGFGSVSLIAFRQNEIESGSPGPRENRITQMHCLKSTCAG